VLIEGEFPVAAPPQQLLAHLFDARLMASCLPGCESLEAIDDDRYRSVVVVAMAGIKARFDLEVEVVRREGFEVWAVTRGAEGGQASTLRAESQVTLAPSPEGTLVRYRSDVTLTGRLGRFALGMMKKKAQSMGDEFAANLRTQFEQTNAAAGARPTAPAAVAAPQTIEEPAPAKPRNWWRRLLAWLRGSAAGEPASRG